MWGDEFGCQLYDAPWILRFILNQAQAINIMFVAAMLHSGLNRTIPLACIVLEFLPKKRLGFGCLSGEKKNTENPFVGPETFGLDLGVSFAKYPQYGATVVLLISCQNQPKGSSFCLKKRPISLLMSPLQHQGYTQNSKTCFWEPLWGNGESLSSREPIRFSNGVSSLRLAKWMCCPAGFRLKPTKGGSLEQRRTL